MVGSYDYGLILLSILVAFVLSLIAFGLSAWIYRKEASGERYWLLSGAAAMGSIIWSVQLASLLFFSAEKPAHYDVDLLIVSWLITIAVSWFALKTVTRSRLNLSAFIVGVMIVGGGLSSTCHLSIYALRLTPADVYNPSLFSIFVAILLTILLVVSLLFFWVRAPQLKQNWVFGMLGTALLPVLAVGMYFIAITMLGSVPHDLDVIFSSTTTPPLLAVIIAIGTTGLILLIFFFSIFGLRAVNDGDAFNLSLKKANRELSHMAMIDALTQLPNRRLFQQHLEMAIGRSSRVGSSLALAYIDLDGFKPVNDELGHNVGDEVLQAVAKRLNMAVRGCDVVARMGGDEFVALIEDIKSDQDIVMIVERIVQALRDIFYIANHEIAISASVGIAVYPRDGNIKRLMECADAAMYRAKSDGKDRFRFFDSEIELASYRLLEMQRELNHALANDEFELHFQPKIDSKTHALTGIEALLRWQHPTKGIISPAVFIPAAERFGLISPIGDWVIEETCRLLHRLRNQGIHLKIAVNLSPQQFRNANLVTNVLQVLDRFDLPVSAIMFEITGCSTMHNQEQFNSLINDFKTAGIGLAMDDFCTGNFSLAYFKKIRVSELKLDQSLIASIDDEQSRAVLDAVIRLARALKTKVVAVGVETEAQRKVLAELGCDELQGFLFSRPVPEEKLATLVRQWASVQQTSFPDDVA